MKFLKPFLLLSSLTILIIACQRDGDIGKPEGPEVKLSSKDPVALSKAIKVWHGVRTAGNMPAPRGAGLELMPSAEPVRAFAGRYAIIKPEIMSGDVKGYYISVNGSSEHFKVDYTKPREVPGSISPGRNRRRTLPTPNSTMSGTLDSSIVIVIPASISVPDTFCVSYSAYDSLGTISTPVTTCIIVSNVGPDAAGGWMTGNWRITASFDSNFRDTFIYNRWTLQDTVYCGVDSFSATPYLIYYNNGTPPLGGDSAFHIKADLQFASNGGQRYEAQSRYKNIDHATSSCSSISLVPEYVEEDELTGAWTYNSATGKMVLIFEFDDTGVPVIEAWEYDVIKINNNHFLMVDFTFPGDPYFIRWQK